MTAVALRYPLSSLVSSAWVTLVSMTRERNPQRKADWIAALAAEQGEGCRDWPWGVDAHGYPQMRLDTRVRKVAHLVLEAAGHPRPGQLVSLHACDRPVCMAPWHLRWGTQGENMREKVERGRARGRNSR